MLSNHYKYDEISRDEMPLPTLRNKQENLGNRGEDTSTKVKSLSFKTLDPDQRIPKNQLAVVDSPLNDSLMMLEDLAQDIKVRRRNRILSIFDFKKV